MTTPLTPAEFALGETRFKKQFRGWRPDEDAMPCRSTSTSSCRSAQRGTRVPFIYATDDDRHLIKVACSTSIVALVEDRRRYWQTLQYLSGVHEEQLTALHESDFEELKAQYEQAITLRETSLDDIAQRDDAPGHLQQGAHGSRLCRGGGSGAGAARRVRRGLGPRGHDDPVSALPIYLDPADELLCTDCGTCYQELPQFFEKATMVVDGKARVVAQMIPGAVDKVEITPELQKRIDRVKANCDAEIIR
jgi:pyruvate-ferredoxin/flavodoxin oxidoreductase